MTERATAEGTGLVPGEILYGDGDIAINAGAQRQLQFGKEDIAAFLDRGGVVVGADAERLAAMLVVDVEAREVR